MVFNEFEWCRAVIIKIHDRLVQYISLECRTAPRIWRLRGIPELTCAPPVLDGRLQWRARVVVEGGPLQLRQIALRRSWGTR
jgi:hypothetical protein